jgi:hypothetical protein
MSGENQGRAVAAGTPPSGHILKRIGLGSLTALFSVNIWTGAPLLALWVGSKVQGNFSSLSMGAVALVVVVLAIVELGMLFLLGWANVRYDEVIGRPPQRRRYPWLSSMRGERQEVIVQRQGVSAVERIIVLSVVTGVLVFEFWFFFLAGSSLPNS